MNEKDFRKLICSENSYSDEYIAHLLSQLASKNIKWKWDNREKDSLSNPYRHIEDPATVKLLKRYRPRIFKAVFK